MGRLFGQIRRAIEGDRFLISFHADERCEEREISPWQLAAGIGDATLIRERPAKLAKPVDRTSANTCRRNSGRIDLVVAESDSPRKAGYRVLSAPQAHKTMKTSKERREKRKRWVQRGKYAVEVEIEVIYPADDPSEPCLEPDTVRFLDEVARRAAKGDLDFLRRNGRVFRAVA
jgi:hypothetical protein